MNAHTGNEVKSHWEKINKYSNMKQYISETKVSGVEFRINVKIIKIIKRTQGNYGNGSKSTEISINT